MGRINVGVIGTGWCGGIRARTAAASALVGELHICETNPDRLAEVAAETNQPVTLPMGPSENALALADLSAH